MELGLCAAKGVRWRAQSRSKVEGERAVARIVRHLDPAHGSAALFASVQVGAPDVLDGLSPAVARSLGQLVIIIGGGVSSAGQSEKS